MAAVLSGSDLILGPPELCNYIPLADRTSQDEATTPLTTGDDFIDMLRNGMKELQPDSDTAREFLYMGMTENFSPTFLTSGNPLLDFFFQVVPDTPSDRVTELLEAAWNKDPLTALKLVCQLRGVRGTGKSDRESFYAAACWIHSHHPKTLAANVDNIAQFGYFKDLPEILVRLLQGSEATEKRKAEKIRHKEKIRSAKGKAKAKAESKSEPRQMRFKRRLGGPLGYFARKGAAAREAKKLGTLKPREERIAADLSNGKIQRERARVIRKEKRLEAANLALKRYLEDSRYRALHDLIAEIFTTLLSKDLEALKLGKVKGISLAAKWCPSLDSSYDRSTLLCENIARRLFPREDFNTEEDRHYVYRARDRLRKQVLVPLRKALQLPEVYMSSNLWGELPYERVASVAMKNYNDIFMKHDAARFTVYLEDVEAGKKKIAAGALLPHEIIEQALESNGSAAASVAEMQWKRMVEDMKKEGKFSNTLAVCDVSGSMSGTPMEVCIALGLLVSEISDEPWKGHVMTFSESPQLHLVTGNSLIEKYTFTQSMDWGMNTDFQKVFDVILNMAAKCRLEPEKMIKQLLVFSDMEFDEASANPWKTDYMVIKNKFRDAGYGVPPRIVFWNLRDSISTPVLKEEEGVAMVSGFSKNQLKLFVESNGDINPMMAMKKAIEGKLFERLRIVD